MSDITLAGDGYRVIIGWLTLLILLILIGISYYLLYTRGHLQPLKGHSPFLLATLTLQLYLGLVWIQFREIGWIELTCSQLMWVAVWEAVLFSLPIMATAYRLVLITRFEKLKIEYAKNPATVNLSSGGFHKSTLGTAMVLLACCLPPLLYLPLIQHYNPTYEWDATACEYAPRSFLLAYCLSIGYLCSIGCAIIYMMWREAVPDDGLGIRRNLIALIPWANTFVSAWILLNLFLPRVNIEYIESSYLLFGIGPAVLYHSIIKPARQTWTFEQTRALALVNANTGAGGINQPHKTDAGGNRIIDIRNRQSTVTSGLTSGAGGVTSGTTAATSSGAGAGTATGAGTSGGEVSLMKASKHTLLAVEFAGQPLMKVLSDEAGWNAFLRFSQLEFSAENVLFLRATDEYREEATIEGALRLYRTFIAEQSKLQVNLSSDERMRVVNAIGPHLTSAERADMSRFLPPEVAGTPSAAAAAAFSTANGKKKQRNKSNPPAVAAAAAESAKLPAAPTEVAALQIVVMKTGTETAPAAGAGAGAGGEPPLSPAAGARAEAKADTPLPGAVSSGPTLQLTVTGAGAGTSPLISTRSIGAGAGVSTGTGAGTDRKRHSTAIRSLATIFDGAQKEIYLMLESDVFARFKRSKLGLSVQSVWYVPPPTVPGSGGLAAGGLAPPTPSFGPMQTGSASARGSSGGASSFAGVATTRRSPGPVMNERKT